MTKIRRRRPRFEFVQILNAVARDYRVSWRARGLLTELLSYPEDYETSVDELVKKAKLSGGNVEGREAMRTAARELKDVGYIVVRRYQNEHGHWVTENEVTDDPMYDLIAGDQEVSAGRTDDGFSGVGSPGVGFSGVNKKTEKKTEKKILPPTPSFERGPNGAGAGREEEFSSEKKTTAKRGDSKAPRAEKATADAPTAPGINDEMLRRAQELVDDAVRLWPKNHRAPSVRDRQRLSERVAGELASGGDETVIVYEMSRDLQDAGSAVKVVMGSRTTTPGWGQTNDPRPNHSRHEVRTKTPWCGSSACDERTRLVNVYDDSTGETKPSQCHTPIQDPVTGETVACHPRATPRVEANEDQAVEDAVTDPALIEEMRASLAAREREARERKEKELAATRALFAKMREDAAREREARLSRH